MLVIEILLFIYILLNTFLFPKETVKMVFVNGGRYKMGKEIGFEAERSVHVVYLESFWIGKYEVTQQEWEIIMTENPSVFNGKHKPVDNVSWYDAVKFCNRLSEREGLNPVYDINRYDVTCDFSKNGYRLPTEAEWEFAARGGLLSKGYLYSGSNSHHSVAWFGTGEENAITHPVGKKEPNELGLYDMSGNVSEWCWDYYDVNFYRYCKFRNIWNVKGPEKGEFRVLRGGDVMNPLTHLLTTTRSYGTPVAAPQDKRVGLRLARTPEGPLSLGIIKRIFVKGE